MPFVRTIEQRIRNKLNQHQEGLYVVLLFPISVAFILTFIACRMVSHVAPHLYLQLSSGLHVHHFIYGFFSVTAAGFLALVFNGPRAKFWIAMLFGFGLGLSFDEYGIWLHLNDGDPLRWQYDGFVIVISAILLLFTIQPGLRFIKKIAALKKKF